MGKVHIEIDDKLAKMIQAQHVFQLCSWAQKKEPEGLKVYKQGKTGSVSTGYRDWQNRAVEEEGRR